jgi:hypothetical protein
LHQNWQSKSQQCSCSWQQSARECANGTHGKGTSVAARRGAASQRRCCRSSPGRSGMAPVTLRTMPTICGKITKTNCHTAHDSSSRGLKHHVGHEDSSMLLPWSWNTARTPKSCESERSTGKGGGGGPACFTLERGK